MISPILNALCTAHFRSLPDMTEHWRRTPSLRYSENKQKLGISWSNRKEPAPVTFCLIISPHMIAKREESITERIVKLRSGEKWGPWRSLNELLMGEFVKSSKFLTSSVALWLVVAPLMLHMYPARLLMEKHRENQKLVHKERGMRPIAYRMKCLAMS